MSRAGTDNESKDLWKMAGLKKTLEGPGSKLECPICFDDLLPPIFQCFNGHLLCATCIDAVAVCPICRDVLPERKIKALAMEKLLREFKHPCPYSEQGCQKVLTYSDGDHPFQCLYAHRACLESSSSLSKALIEIETSGKKGNELDPGRSEGSFSFTVDNVSEGLQGTKSMRSPVMYVQNLPWRILLEPHYQGGTKKFLGIYLECVEEGPNNWSCTAMVTFRILSHITEANGAVNHHTKEFNKHEQFRSGSCYCSWGFNEFLDWGSLMDPAKGFEKNGSVTVDVHIDADIPRRGHFQI